MADKKLADAIRKYAIKNAIDYGTAKEGSVMGRILSEFPETKSDMKGLAKQVAEIIKQVNSLSKDDIQKEYGKHSKEFEREAEEKAKESVPKFILEGAVKGRFVTRYAPAPNGYMHIGHAKAALVADEAARVYDGKIVLYFDDTNPEKDRQEYVDAMKRDLSWLEIKFAAEHYASDNMALIYESARKLIKQGSAYACECDAETMSKNRYDGKACKHRERSASQNEKIFEDMLKGKYDEGSEVIRFMGDMKSNNTVLRDPTLLRIKKDTHYRQGDKYIVWPTYDINTPINDSINGVTDVIRSKEFELRDELAAGILDALKMRKPRIHSEARLVIKDNITHKRELNKLMEEDVLEGWDDPRLTTIAALRRRGIAPEAIRKFVLRFGLSKTDSEVDLSMLLDENRKVIDKTSKRLFFVGDPKKITVEGIENHDVKMRLLPENDKEFRRYKLGNAFYISGREAENLRVGDRIRFKDLFNVEIKNLKGTMSCRFIGDDQKVGKTLQWVNEGNCIKAQLQTPGKLLINGKFNKDSIETADGLLESYANNLKEGEVVQFERVGFARLDDKKRMLFIGC